MPKENTKKYGCFLVFVPVACAVLCCTSILVFPSVLGCEWYENITNIETGTGLYCKDAGFPTILVKYNSFTHEITGVYGFWDAWINNAREFINP